MTSFAITLYGQRCRRRVVGQRIVSDIDVVCSGWSNCSLCSESNNSNLLLYAYWLLYLERLFCFTYQTHFAPQDGGVYLVTTDRVFSDVTVPYLYCVQTA